MGRAQRNPSLFYAAIDGYRFAPPILRAPGMTTSIELSEPDAMTFAKDGALRIRAALDARICGGSRMRSRICRRTRPASGFTGFLRFGRFLHHQARSGRWRPRPSAQPPGRSEPSSSTRRLPPTGDFRGIRIERSWSPSGLRSKALARGPSKAVCFTWRHRLIRCPAWVTLRVHFDPVPETNAPLLIAPGSHRLGQIPARRS